MSNRHFHHALIHIWTACPCISKVILSKSSISSTPTSTAKKKKRQLYCTIISIVTYEDNITITVGSIINNKSSFQEEINSLADWCTEINVSKTMELIVGFIIRQQRHTFLSTSVELRCNSFMFLGITITISPFWSLPPWLKKQSLSLLFTEKVYILEPQL